MVQKYVFFLFIKHKTSRAQFQKKISVIPVYVHDSLNKTFVHSTLVPA